MLEDTDRAGFARGGLAAMPALDAAPELYRPMPAADDPLTRQDARRDEDFALRAAAQATALTRALSAAPPEGEPDGMAARLLARFDDESAVLLDGAPSLRAEDAARAAIGRARGRFADWALPQEAAAQIVTRRQTLIDTLAQFRAAAEQTPDDVDALHAEGMAAIGQAADWLGEQEAQELARQWSPVIHESSLAALVNREPEEAKRQILSGRYGMLDVSRRNSWMQKASVHSDSLAADRLHSQQQETDRRDLERENNRWKFNADFVRALREGTAQYRAIYEAFESGQISEIDRNSYEARLRANDSARLQERERIDSVNRLLEGDTTVRPSYEDIGIHYRIVMKPIMDQSLSEDRGRLFLDYLHKLGRYETHPDEQAGKVDSGLPPPTDDLVDPKDIHALLGYDPNGIGEVALVRKNLLNGIITVGEARKAYLVTEEIFAGLPTHNSPADAFRHAYWSFVMTRARLGLPKEYGPKIAKIFTDAHEVKKVQETWANLYGRQYEPQPEGERLMDLYNNAVGHRLALLPENRNIDPKKLILRALSEGKLQTREMAVRP